jgi:hypothetical protein
MAKTEAAIVPRNTDELRILFIDSPLLKFIRKSWPKMMVKEEAKNDHREETRVKREKTYRRISAKQ